jgi:two-component system phosphate regulon response regulator PhoB
MKAVSSSLNPTLKPYVRGPVRLPSRFLSSRGDDADTLTMIVRALEQEQYIVSKATSGPEALRMIDEHIPDLVVLDYKMTGMDGMAVMKTLRAKPATHALPVLMLTAMADEPSTRAGFEAGVTDYVTKPFSIPQLTSRVRACLTRIQLQ